VAIVLPELTAVVVPPAVVLIRLSATFPILTAVSTSRIAATTGSVVCWTLGSDSSCALTLFKMV
jgi:hypothetical protein